MDRVWVDEPHWIEFATADPQGRWTIDDLGPSQVYLEASTDLDVPVPSSLLDLGARPHLDLVRGGEPDAIDVANKHVAMWIHPRATLRP